MPASSLLGKFVDERFNREAPLIDHRALSHYGRLAHCRPKPAIAARKCALYVLPGSIYRQVCPTEGIFVMCDHNDCAIPRQFIELVESPPYNFNVRNHTVHCITGQSPRAFTMSITIECLASCHAISVQCPKRKWISDREAGVLILDEV
jgi:hypothetical protein